MIAWIPRDDGSNKRFIHNDCLDPAVKPRDDDSSNVWRLKNRWCLDAIPYRDHIVAIWILYSRLGWRFWERLPIKPNIFWFFRNRRGFWMLRRHCEHPSPLGANISKELFWYIILESMGKFFERSVATKQSIVLESFFGLLRRYAPRNDGVTFKTTAIPEEPKFWTLPHHNKKVSLNQKSR